MNVQYRDVTFTIGRRWFRFYLGGTGRPDRGRRWKDGERRGAYVRIGSTEQVIGYQQRKRLDR